MTGLDVKKEIAEKRAKNADEKLAILSGFVRVTFSLYKKGIDDGFGLILDCQNHDISDYIASLTKELFSVAPVDKRNDDDGKRGKFKIDSSSLLFAEGEKLLKGLYIIPGDNVFDVGGISDKIKSLPCYARGVFLGCGSVSVPSADSAQSDKKSGGYHIEFAFYTEDFANEFLALLSKYNIYAHLTRRGGKYVVYVKYISDVSDCLALIGADRAVLDMNAAAATYAVKSDVNRRLNCELANMSRTVDASVGVTEAVDVIESSIGLDALDEKLREAALARRGNPQASIGNIAKELGISKSGLKHRFDKLIKIANGCKNGKNNRKNFMR
ncbi:MAG: DNA-binding protein WhiA [Clostridiales bacterium]|nr:DNA-binding protein WhiA [Clostridiales bacterium]